jgi:pSer/pThr/pTyr-binding forkhead associated (FHA) protein
VIQFDQDGDAYLYDMDSAHGTRLNKKQIPGREYVPLKPGDQIRFGESTRLCIFDSDKPFDPEAEAEERRRIALKQKIASAQGEELTPDDDEEDTGASWGFAEDAVEEEEEEEEDEQDPEKRAAYIEASLNQSGDASLLNVEAAKMALEDAKRRREDLEIMYGDDSDEELYDKTSRKKKKVEKAETHDELVVRQKQTEQKIAQLEHDLAEKKKQEAAAKEQEEEDLDSFMQKLSKKPLGNEKSIFVLQKELNQLKKVSEFYRH